MKKNINKKITILASLLFLPVFNIHAYAINTSDIYAKVEIGSAIPANKIQTDSKKGYLSSNKPKSSLMYGIGGGYKFTDSIRADLMISGFKGFKASKETIADVTFLDHNGSAIQTSKADASSKMKVKSSLIMASVYYDIIDINGFTPYVTAGVGLARNKTDPYQITNKKNKDITYKFKGKTKNNFAFGVGAGVGYKLNNKIRLDAQYKYLDLGKFEHNGIDFYSSQKKNIFTNPDAQLRSKFRTHSLTASLSYSF